jgi:hypothetical protein
MSTTPIQLAASMLDARDTLRRLMGPERFAAKCAELAPVMAEIEKSPEGLLAIISRIATQMEKEGRAHSAVLLVAVAVERIEPAKGE